MVHRLVAVCLAAVTAAAVAGCSTADPSATTSAVGSSSATATASATAGASGTASPSASSTVPVADPSHAVPAPGPRSGELHSADILVRASSTLTADQIAAIKALPKVTGIEQLSIGEVSIEDKLLNVVAVDPSTYRNYTPLASADATEVWDRVAGGELAVNPDLKKDLPPDAQGYWRMGSNASAPRIHVGAWAAQIPGLVDVVVNTAWGKALGMVPDNAVIISTSITSPERVTKPLKRLLGTAASVQRLDAVARYGLDPNAVQFANVVGTVAQAVGHYTYRVLGGGMIAPDPAWVSAHIATESVPILGNVTCNKYLFPQLEAALAEVQARGLAGTIHSTAGCYYPRFIAGTSSLSNHAFGLAIDINAPENERGTSGQMNRQVVQIFQKWGFTWGGTWHYTDPMHFEMNKIVTPR
ncbi:M15 family metallopeptidase [Nocardioides sp. BP30]|uniref:M15 family metallopeptidase n=1 Tax=Nocardioides sp. BP30 TaxID=3036374 RepID=UPI002468E765|nr:M15 family metallopeptidase [Nocardioides sp. BP30]WGL52637.1 M15 family metallopeptidase [Nocardioides sp. BP30]